MPNYRDMTFCADSRQCANFECWRHWNDEHEKASTGQCIEVIHLRDECGQFVPIGERQFREWPIERTPKMFSGDDFFEMVDRFPARVDCCDGMIGENNQQRLLMLAMLIENIGIDAVVKIGPLQLWIDAVNAERERLEHD